MRYTQIELKDRYETMARPHPFVRYLQLQSLLAKVVSEMHALETSDVNYRLDREFSAKLDELISRYGYTDQEVVEIVELAQEHEAHGNDGIRVLMERIPQDVGSSVEGEK
ncbi:hypothetical protein D3C77_370520 [compost metagenome]